MYFFYSEKGSHRADGGRQKTSGNISLALNRRSRTPGWSSWVHCSSFLSGSVPKVAQCLQWTKRECVCVWEGAEWGPEVHDFTEKSKCLKIQICSKSILKSKGGLELLEEGQTSPAEGHLWRSVFFYLSLTFQNILPRVHIHILHAHRLMMRLFMGDSGPVRSECSFLCSRFIFRPRPCWIIILHIHTLKDDN